jgi:xylose isomerase
MSDLDPRPEHRFTFGLWTVGNVGRDPFGLPTRPARDPTQTVRKLAEIGAWGVNLHDNDLVPLDATSGERDRIVREFKQALDDHGLVVPMATTNLFSDPAFKDGALSCADSRVRGFAVQKVMRAMDLGVELGAGTFVFWGGREGSEVDATLDAVDALARYRESLDFLAAYAADQDYALRFALEAKPNEPRGDLYLPVVGSMLGFIHTLDQPERFGVNPEFAHETMAGLNFVHAVAQALDAGKLFHIDLNDQRMSRFDQDLRFAAENLKGAFFLVKLLEDAGYDGPRHFDAHALRTEDEDGVWDFARGCMRSYLILKDKAARFDADPEIQQLVRGHRVADDKLDGYLAAYSPESAERIARRTFDLDALRNRPTHLERLDQLTIELLLGAR